MEQNTPPPTTASPTILPPPPPSSTIQKVHDRPYSYLTGAKNHVNIAHDELRQLNLMITNGLPNVEAGEALTEEDAQKLALVFRLTPEDVDKIRDVIGQLHALTGTLDTLYQKSRGRIDVDAGRVERSSIEEAATE